MIAKGLTEKYNIHTRQESLWPFFKFCFHTKEFYQDVWSFQITKVTHVHSNKANNSELYKVPSSTPFLLQPSDNPFYDPEIIHFKT